MSMMWFSLVEVKTRSGRGQGEVRPGQLTNMSSPLYHPDHVSAPFVQHFKLRTMENDVKNEHVNCNENEHVNCNSE